MEVFEMFQDKDPQVLYMYYQQLGKNKELLIECMLNGGELPEGIGEQEEEDHKQEEDDNGLGDLVGIDMEADPEVIQR